MSISLIIAIGATKMIPVSSCVVSTIESREKKNIWIKN